MVTLEQAREIATAAMEPGWSPERGTFYVAPWGWEDESTYSLAVGAREWIEQGDYAYEDTSSSAVLVDKRTGTLSVEYVTPTVAQHLAAMRPIGPGHPEIA